MLAGNLGRSLFKLGTERDKELADTKFRELNGAVSKKAQTRTSGEAINRCFLNGKDTIARFFNLKCENSGLGG